MDRVIIFPSTCNKALTHYLSVVTNKKPIELIHLSEMQVIHHRSAPKKCEPANTVCGIHQTR